VVSGEEKVGSKVTGAEVGLLRQSRPAQLELPQCTVLLRFEFLSNEMSKTAELSTDYLTKF